MVTLGISVVWERDLGIVNKFLVIRLLSVGFEFHRRKCRGDVPTTITGTTLTITVIGNRTDDSGMFIRRLGNSPLIRLRPAMHKVK